MPERHISVFPLEASRCEDFYRVHSVANGAGWCYCAAWWVPTWESWGQRTAEENRALRKRLFRQGQYDGYLLYVDGYPAAWCQCGLRDRLPNLLEHYDLRPDPGVWAVTCFLIVPRFRKRGLAQRVLSGILKDLKTVVSRAFRAFRAGVMICWTRTRGLDQRPSSKRPGFGWSGMIPKGLLMTSGCDDPIDGH